jgi:hypothetical protein
MVVAKKVRFTRVCFQLLNPPMNSGRMPSTIKLKDMHKTIQPNFCQAGMSSNAIKNVSMGTN